MLHVTLACTLVIVIVIFLFAKGYVADKLTFNIVRYMSQRKILLLYLGVINLVTFILFGIDKYAAIKGKWRIPVINLDIEAGEIVALVGPNGSGKSTLMKCIMGFSNIDSGEIWIFDSLNNKKALKDVACSIEYPPLYPDLSGLDHF